MLAYANMLFGGEDYARLTSSVTVCGREEVWAGEKDLLPDISARLEKKVVDRIGAWAAASHVIVVTPNKTFLNLHLLNIGVLLYFHLSEVYAKKHIKAKR